uniref:Uncharacterized protein n=1 Tax=Knipowitschia caucasica TaxID=637954 RepID=A0AAV2KSJ2_KNICA
MASKSHRHLKTQPCDLEITPYSQVDTTIRKMALMRLTVGLMTLVHPVYISPFNTHPLLLGQDLLNRFKPLIDYQRLKIWTQVREPLPIPRPLGENHRYSIDAPPTNGPQPAAAQPETDQGTPTTCANATRTAPDLDSRQGIKISRWCTGRAAYLLLRGTWDIHGSRVGLDVSAEQEEDAAKSFHSPLDSVTYH